MAGLARRQRRTTDIWPGFVDALATLLMVIIFLLMIFVLAQVYLADLLSGKDETLERLRGEVGQLADLLALERKANNDLRADFSALSGELQASIGRGDDLERQIAAMTARAAQLTKDLETSEAAQRQLIGELDATDMERRRLIDDVEATRSSLDSVSAELADAFKVIDADKEKIELQLQTISTLTRQIDALIALKGDLEGKLASTAQSLTEEQKKTLAALAETALLNDQLGALRNQIAQLNAALEAAEILNAEQKVQIENLGSRLNAALATKVAELSRFRSEFFGQLREVLGDQDDIRVVGDRFVFQSEVLFEQGSADIETAGEGQLERVATVLKQVIPQIPEGIDWVLRVDGHTDRVPIKTAQFPSNWELSTARAISVVRYLMDQGIPPNRLAATGFGEYRPLETGTDETAYRRNRRIELKLTQR
ncbi:MAG: peptidoglycan -binding protein [Magnetospiraceae bacterium]